MKNIKTLNDIVLFLEKLNNFRKGEKALKFEKYRPYLIGLVFIGALSVLVACSPRYMTFNGHTIEVSSMSSETVAWLEYYNSLTDEEKMYISYCPPELVPYLDNYEDVIEFEKPNSIMAKVINVDVENKQVLISSNGVVYLANYDDVEKLKSGYIVETIYSQQVENEDSAIVEIIPESMTIISATYDLVGLYLDAVKGIWEDNAELNKNSGGIVLNLEKVVNLSNSDKTALIYCIGSELDKIVVNGTIDNVKKDDMYIELEYLAIEKEEVEKPNSDIQIDVSIELADVVDESVAAFDGDVSSETVEVVEDVPVEQSSKTPMFKFNISKTKCSVDESYGYVTYTDCVVYGESSNISWELGERTEG